MWFCVSCFVRVCYVVSSQLQHAPRGFVVCVRNYRWHVLVRVWVSFFRVFLAACYVCCWCCCGSLFFSVVIASGKRPVTFRTRKLRLIALMVLHSGGCGRVGHCRKLFLGGGASLFSHPPPFFCVCVCVPHVFWGCCLRSAGSVGELCYR